MKTVSAGSENVQPSFTKPFEVSRAVPCSPKLAGGSQSARTSDVLKHIAPANRRAHRFGIARKSYGTVKVLCLGIRFFKEKVWKRFGNPEEVGGKPEEVGSCEGFDMLGWSNPGERWPARWIGCLYIYIYICESRFNPCGLMFISTLSWT